MEIHLTGNMERYMWSFDGKKFTAVTDDPIRFGYDERVRITLINQTMMAHPIHLHGHFFELVNGADHMHQPRNHPMVVQPGGTATFDLTANEPGDWAFHCHMLYHMHAGMMQVVTGQQGGNAKLAALAIGDLQPDKAAAVNPATINRPACLTCAPVARSKICALSGRGFTICSVRGPFARLICAPCEGSIWAMIVRFVTLAISVSRVNFGSLMAFNRFLKIQIYRVAFPKRPGGKSRRISCSDDSVWYFRNQSKTLIKMVRMSPLPMKNLAEIPKYSRFKSLP